MRIALGLPAGISDGPGAACWDLPTPWVWRSDPRKKNPLPGSVFGRVWSCLVRSTSLLVASLRCCLNWGSGITALLLLCMRYLFMLFLLRGTPGNQGSRGAPLMMPETVVVVPVLCCPGRNASARA